MQNGKKRRPASLDELVKGDNLLLHKIEKDMNAANAEKKVNKFA